MSRSLPQLNIRSAFARDRAAALSRQTGMTTTRVVEEALRAWTPPAPDDRPSPPGMVRKGLIWVLTGGKPVTLEQTNVSIEEDRNARGETRP